MANDTEKMAVFEQIENEVRELDGYIVNEIMGKKNELKGIFYGSWLYYSPIQINPKFMFLGINPGAGWFKLKKENEETPGMKPLKGMEYAVGEYSYAKQWQSIFESDILKQKGGFDLLKDAFKTNYYYQATENASGLGYIKGSLIRSEKKINLEELSAKWTKQMVLTVNPKVLICEGFGAFKKVEECFGNEFKFMEDETNRGIPKNLKCGQIGNIKVLGVRRVISSIPKISRELIAKKLDEYL